MTWRICLNFGCTVCRWRFWNCSSIITTAITCQYRPVSSDCTKFTQSLQLPDKRDSKNRTSPNGKYTQFVKIAYLRINSSMECIRSSCCMYNSDQVKSCNYIQNKVITTMVIRLLGNCIYCATSAFTHLGLGESCTIVQCIASQPANVFSNLPYGHFCRSP